MVMYENPHLFASKNVAVGNNHDLLFFLEIDNLGHAIRIARMIYVPE